MVAVQLVAMWYVVVVTSGCHCGYDAKTYADRDLQW